MLRKFFRLFLILLQSCVLCLLLACGAFLWRLHHAPINVDGIIPYVIHAFAIPESQAKINIKSAQLIWRKASHPVDLVVKDFQVNDKNGTLISSVPELSLTLSLQALLRGIIAPKSLAIRRPSLRLYIGKDGTVRSSKEISEKDTEKTENDLPLEAIVSYLEKEVYLSTFSLIDAKIRITDEYHNIEWLIPSADLTYFDKNGLNTLNGALTLKTKTIPLTMNFNGQWENNKTDLALSVSFDNIDASRLSVADKYPFLKQWTTPIHFQTTFYLDTAPFFKTKKLSSLRDTIQKIDFLIKGGKGRLLLPAPVVADYDLTSFFAVGSIFDKGDKFNISKFNVQIANGNASGNISVQGIGKALDAKNWESISAVMNASVSNIPVNNLPAYWPATIEPDIHDWVKTNMKNGLVSDGTFNLHFIGLKDEASVDCDEVSGTVHVKKTDISYMDGMPEVKNVSGTLHLTRDVVNIDIDSGNTFDVFIKKGLISFYNLKQKLSDGKVILELDGSLSDALKILDEPALDITKELGLIPEETSGNASGTLQLDFPIGDAFVSEEQIKVSADAVVENAELNNLVAGYGLNDASLKLNVQGMDVFLSGTASFLGSPADFTLSQSFDPQKNEKLNIIFNTVLNDKNRADFDFDTGLFIPPTMTGPVNVSLNLKEDKNASAVVNIDFDLNNAVFNLRPAGWMKPAGTKGNGKLTLLLKNNDLTDIPFFSLTDVTGNEAYGNIKFDDNELLTEIELSALKTGRTNAKARIRFNQNSIDIDVAGRSLDLSKAIDNPEILDETEDSEENEEEETSLTINAAVDKIWLSEKGFTTNNALYAVRKKSVWEEIKTIGLVGEQSIPLKFTLLPDTNGKDYKYSLVSEDAGGTLAALDYITSVRGGRLNADGIHTPGKGSKGLLHVSQFRMVEMPVLSRILMLTSFTGIVDLFKGEGLVFDKAEIPYTINDAAVAVHDGVVSGASLGVTLNGKYFRESGYLNLRGSLIPFYTLNSFLGKIPVIGKIFAGEKGGGLIAPTYTVKGKLPSPHISVNAFSALAPGAVRELVDKMIASDEDLGEPVSEQSPSTGNGLKKQTESKEEVLSSPTKSTISPAQVQKHQELAPPLKKSLPSSPQKKKEKILTDSLQYAP